MLKKISIFASKMQTMEKEMVIENMKKPKTATQSKVRLNDYNWEIGQIEKGGKSLYMMLGAYVTHNDEIKLSKHFSRLNERLSHLVAKSSSELFKTLNKRMPFILTHDCSDIKTKDKWTYFSIEITLYFSENIKLDDIRDELYLLGYVICDYLEDEVGWLQFKSRK